MASFEKKPIDPEHLKLYDKLVDSHPEIERKGKTLPYTSVNGHMFSVFSSEGLLGIRLPKEEREKFLEEYNTTLLASYGAVMREYVTIPDSLLKNTKKLRKYLDMSYEYVKSLKPKPKKKK